MKKLLLPAFIFSLAYPSLGQLRPVYPFQKDDQGIRKSYAEQSSRKKDAWMAAADKKYASEYRKIYQSHFTEINKLWESDRVVTDPVAHGYLQALVQKVKASNPALTNSDARLVFSRDWWPNAYSMGDGSIAINAGLMVYLDNEAELIFIICHELAHYYLDHTSRSIKKYVETVNSESFQKELKRLSKAEYRVNQQLEALTREFTFSSRRHSRENETEADLLAFQFMKNTGYECRAIESCLRLLDKVDDTLLFQRLDLPQVFHFEDYPFRQAWIRQETSIFSQVKKEDNRKEKTETDSLKTHPDCERRIAVLQDSINAGGDQGAAFLVDEVQFRKLKKDFMVEMAEQCYRDGNLSRNLYFSLLLLQSEDYKPYAVHSIARCIQTIYRDQRDHKLGTKVDVENAAYPADYNLLLRMLSRVRLPEIANLGFRFCRKHEVFMSGYAGFREIMENINAFEK